MIVIVGLVILAAAVIAGTAGVLANSRGRRPRWRSPAARPPPSASSETT
jgi:hypothetical protein